MSREMKRIAPTTPPAMAPVWDFKLCATRTGSGACGEGIVILLGEATDEVANGVAHRVLLSEDMEVRDDGELARTVTVTVDTEIVEDAVYPANESRRSWIS